MSYVLTYIRPEKHEKYSPIEHVTVTLDDDRTVYEMRLAFDDFLGATGYTIEKDDDQWT